jgi:hypothetical protein
MAASMGNTKHRRQGNVNIAPQNKPIRNTSQHTGSSSGLLRDFTIRESSTKQGAIPEAGENTPKPRNKEARGEETPDKARKTGHKQVEQDSGDELGEWVDVEEELNSDSEWVSISTKHC